MLDLSSLASEIPHVDFALVPKLSHASPGGTDVQVEHGSFATLTRLYRICIHSFFAQAMSLCNSCCHVPFRLICRLPCRSFMQKERLITSKSRSPRTFTPHTFLLRRPNQPSLVVLNLLCLLIVCSEPWRGRAAPSYSRNGNSALEDSKAGAAPPVLCPLPPATCIPSYARISNSLQPHAPSTPAAVVAYPLLRI